MTKTTQPRQPRSCAPLGVCQFRHGCDGSDGCARHDTHTLPPGGFYFAPGTVEEAHKSARKTARTDTLGRWLLTAAALAALGTVIGMAAGWLTVGGFL